MLEESYHMADTRASMFEKRIIVPLLCDVQTSCSEVFSKRALRLTIQKVEKRITREGIGFLTKTLPRLAKALDRALTGEVPIDSAKLRFESQPNSKLPRFLGELFNSVFSRDGWILPTPCVKSITMLRQLLLVFYKYELPYDSEQENEVIKKFIRTEDEISPHHDRCECAFRKLERVQSEYARSARDTRVPLFGRDESHCRKEECKAYSAPGICRNTGSKEHDKLVKDARALLSKAFAFFDPLDIYPRHGPGAVSTRERLWAKYRWTNVPERLRRTYPLDAYFYASVGHVCDQYKAFNSLGDQELSARVCLVPKDSRGPRLISCEPLAFQWIQQGLGRAMVKHLELNPLTRFNIHFTDQQPNQFGALLGSQKGLYATLDLNEASDRVTVGLVRLLFPEPLLSALLDSRSLSTELPSGEIKPLNKYAPMGSALCFPVLACVVWAILTAGAPDADTRERILVYGDDVVVPTAQAANAIMQLESFGLKVNRDKSCTSGFFRESCGCDAYKGVNVTPVRFRTVWQSSRCPDSYVSWIAYANSLKLRGYNETYDYIVKELTLLYGKVPDASMNLSCPSLLEVPEVYRPNRKRSNVDLQTIEHLVVNVRSQPICKEIDGWEMLLRFFAEANSKSSLYRLNDKPCRSGVEGTPEREPFSVREYTRRGSSKLVKTWLTPGTGENQYLTLVQPMKLYKEQRRWYEDQCCLGR